MAIATHWHSDKTDGLEYYRSLGIKTYTTIRTDELSKLHGKKRAQFLLGADTTFQAGDQSFETYFPGEGHTTDNIVIWFGKERILYAGCLVKGTDAGSLGNLEDANKAAYATTLKRLKKKYPHPAYIIVTHSEGSDTHSLKHSIRLAK